MSFASIVCVYVHGEKPYAAIFISFFLMTVQKCAISHYFASIFFTRLKSVDIKMAKPNFVRMVNGIDLYAVNNPEFNDKLNELFTSDESVHGIKEFENKNNINPLFIIASALIRKFKNVCMFI